MRALALASLLLATSAVPAAERAHTVAAGESAALVAKKYYGDPKLADPLLRYNGKAGRMIHPGERLSIPFCEVYRARPGDTWSALAKDRIGRARAAAALAELNGYAAGQPLRVGARVVFPVVVRHTIARGESLSSIAVRYYGDAKRAATVRSFGQLGDGRLAAGTPLEIPLITFVRADTDSEPSEAKKAPVAVSPPAEPMAPARVAAAPPPVEPRRFERELAAAGRAFTDGEYDRAREMLEALLGPVATLGAEPDRREWSQLLAFVYIALDRDADACAAYRAGSTPAGATTLDPDLVSPRIRAVLSNCTGRLDNPEPSPQIPSHADTRG